VVVVVEVSGRYSNRADQEKRLREVLQLELSRSSKHKTQTPRQVQRRLSANELETLLGSYGSGTPVNELADELHIHRSTVLDHLDRSTARRRYPALDKRGTQLAIQLYNSGLSLREIGISLNVHASTVREILKK
jgi:DNA-binding CsgD family transcriptional regulator